MNNDLASHLCTRALPRQRNRKLKEFRRPITHDMHSPSLSAEAIANGSEAEASSYRTSLVGSSAETSAGNIVAMRSPGSVAAFLDRRSQRSTANEGAQALAAMLIQDLIATAPCASGTAVSYITHLETKYLRNTIRHDKARRDLPEADVLNELNCKCLVSRCKYSQQLKTELQLVARRQLSKTEQIPDKPAAFKTITAQNTREKYHVP